MAVTEKHSRSGAADHSSHASPQRPWLRGQHSAAAIASTSTGQHRWRPKEQQPASNAQSTSSSESSRQSWSGRERRRAGKRKMSSTILTLRSQNETLRLVIAELTKKCVESSRDHTAFFDIYDDKVDAAIQTEDMFSADVQHAADWTDVTSTHLQSSSPSPSLPSPTLLDVTSTRHDTSTQHDTSCTQHVTRNRSDHSHTRQDSHNSHNMSPHKRDNGFTHDSTANTHIATSTGTHSTIAPPSLTLTLTSPPRPHDDDISGFTSGSIEIVDSLAYSGVYSTLHELPIGASPDFTHEDDIPVTGASKYIKLPYPIGAPRDFNSQNLANVSVLASDSAAISDNDDPSTAGGVSGFAPEHFVFNAQAPAFDPTSHRSCGHLPRPHAIDLCSALADSEATTVLQALATHEVNEDIDAVKVRPWSIPSDAHDVLGSTCSTSSLSQGDEPAQPWFVPSESPAFCTHESITITPALNAIMPSSSLQPSTSPYVLPQLTLSPSLATPRPPLLSAPPPSTSPHVSPQPPFSSASTSSPHTTYTRMKATMQDAHQALSKELNHRENGRKDQKTMADVEKPSRALDALSTEELMHIDGHSAVKLDIGTDAGIQFEPKDITICKGDSVTGANGDALEAKNGSNKTIADVKQPLREDLQNLDVHQALAHLQRQQQQRQQEQQSLDSLLAMVGSHFGLPFQSSAN